MHPLFGKTVLVTGATGFIGSQLCRKLLAYEAKVHGISRKQSPGTEMKTHWWYGDLADFDFVQKCITAIKPDIIYHLGSLVSGSRGLDLVLPTFQSNLSSTVNLMVIAAGLGCYRIILAGSMEEPEGEQLSAIPSSPYAAAKWASNGYARMFRELYQLPVYTARIFMVYGPGQQDLNKLIPYVTLSLLRGEVPKLTSGRRQIDWIYVDDVVQGLIAMACTGNIEDDVVDLGSGSLVTIQTVVNKLVGIINPRISPPFGTLPERKLQQTRIARVNRSTAQIKWTPRVSLEQGLMQTVSWYRDNIHPTL